MFTCMANPCKEDDHPNIMNKPTGPTSPFVAPSCSEFNFNLPVVAIDKDRHSLSALRWAIDNLLINDSTVVLLHVKTKTRNCYNPDSFGDIESLMSPFRNHCARRMILVKEYIVEHLDVPKAIIEFVKKNCVTNLVLGASSGSNLTRMVFGHDVAAKVYKSAPDFCTVYVVYKGKTQTISPATRSMMNTPAPTRSPSPLFDLPKSRSYEDVSRVICSRSDPSMVAVNRFDMGKSRLSMDCPVRTQRSSYSHNSESNGDSFSSNYSASNDVKPRNIEDVESVVKDGHSAMKDVDEEMQRLKLELMQTMDLYKLACKDAVSAKQTAKELDDWKLEEARLLKNARLAEVAALEIAELEKAKCQAAIEAAEMAQKIAEKEAQRRIYAELKARREAEEKDRAMSVLAKTDARYRKYSIEELEMGTNNFSNEMKIGHGGYGPVFQAKLDHTHVAIKVLSPDAVEGQKQFHQEVEVLSRIRHPNMVLLLGACPEYGCLVYEFMNNGNLADRLLRKDDTPSIPWEIRFRISAEVATALLFLHQSKPEPLVHRDLKPENILLDRNYVSKISDVGLARLVPPSVAEKVTQYHMTSAAGTLCYIDPEYQQTGELGTKSDIYSLGVMLLQIITGRPPVGLTHHVGMAIEQGTVQDMLDPTVPNWPIDEATSFAKLALKCTELRKKDRPDLATVIVPELNRLKELGMKNL